MTVLIEGMSRIGGGWGILLLSTFTGVVAQLALKHAFSVGDPLSAQGGPAEWLRSVAATWQLWVYGAFAVASLASWLLVVRRFELSVAFPVVQSLSFALILLSSAILFRETITVTKVAGTGLLCLGIWLCSK